jgi:hypothetical protein
VSRWKDHLSRLSGKETAKREAAFEASLLAAAQPAAPPPAPARPAPTAPAAGGGAAGGGTVTEGGATRVYRDLAAVPPHIRQQVTGIWLTTPYQPAP